MTWRSLLRPLPALLLWSALLPRIAFAQTPPAESADSGAEAEITPEAKEHFELGTRHYNLQEWQEAIKEYKEAYRLSPRPGFLWAIAQSQRLGDDCEAAIKSYQAFLRSNPSAQQSSLAWEFIATCQTELAEKKEAQAPPKVEEPPAKKETKETKPAPPPPAPAPPPPAPSPRWYADWLGHTLVVGGVAAGIAGGVALGLGNGSIGEANAATDYATFERSKDSGTTLQQWGMVGIVAGSVLAAGGVIRYVMVERRAEKKSEVALPIVSGFVAPGAFAIGVSASF